jgi:hypothetical protein
MRWQMWIIVAVAIIMPLWHYGLPGEREQLLAARQRWAQRPFADYHLIVETDTCLYDVIVRAGRLHGGARDACVAQARPVEGLFDTIDTAGVRPHCVAGACRCLVYTSVTATYDAELGHPVRIIVRSSWLPHLTSADYWRALLRERRPPACGSATVRHIRVQHIAPLASE